MANSTNKRNYRIDFSTMTLIMTADFAEKAYDPDTDEYEILMRLKKDFPDLKTSRKTHSTPKSYTSKKTGEKFKDNQFKGLTYENMERFLSAIPNSEEYQAEYEYAKKIAEKLRLKPYVLVRDWFLAQFPKYRKNPIVYLTEHPDLVKVADLANVVIVGEAFSSPATPATIHEIKKAG